MRAYYFSELAQLYFPRSTVRSAVYQLHQWIALNTELSERLTELHFANHQRTLTPLQAEAVIRFLGEPGS